MRVRPSVPDFIPFVSPGFFLGDFSRDSGDPVRVAFPNLPGNGQGDECPGPGCHAGMEESSWRR